VFFDDPLCDGKMTSLRLDSGNPNWKKKIKSKPPFVSIQEQNNFKQKELKVKI
jgi:hypothetical protein